MWALLSATYLCSPAPFRNRKHNPSVSLFCFSPSGGKQPSFLSLSPSFSSSHSLCPFLPPSLTLKGPKLPPCLSGATTQMKWHTVGRKEKEAFCCMAWNWIPMTSSARRNTNRGSEVVKGWHSVTLDGFRQWLLYLVVIKWNHCLVISAD